MVIGAIAGAVSGVASLVGGLAGGGSSQTQKTEIADLSALGEGYQDLLKELMMADLESFGGYEVQSETKITYDDPQAAANLTDRLEKMNGELFALEEKLEKNPHQQSLITNQINAKLSQINQVKKTLADLPQKETQEFNITKKPDPRVQQAIDQFGEGSPEVAAVQEQIKADEVFEVEALADVSREYLTNLRKFVSGDMSYTPEQAAQVDQFVAPVKDAILKFSEEILQEAGDNKDRLNFSLDQLSAEIDKSGFAINDALNAAVLQAEQSGKTMFSVFEEANKSSQAKAKFEFDLLSEKIDTQVAQQAALLGLPPGSQAENFQKQKLKSDALAGIELDLANQLASGRLNIQQGVESTKKEISLSRINLAQSQGEKREQIAQTRFNVEQAFGQTRAATIGARADALTELEKSRQGQLQNVAQGNIPSLLQAATQGLTFADQDTARDIAINQSIQQPIATQLGQQQQLRTGQMTGTTQTSGPGFGQAFQSAVDFGAGVASTTMDLQDAFRKNKAAATAVEPTQ